MSNDRGASNPFVRCASRRSSFDESHMTDWIHVKHKSESDGAKVQEKMTNFDKFGPDLRRVIKAYAREILCVDDPSFFAYKIQTLEDFCRWAISKPLGGAK